MPKHLISYDDAQNDLLSAATYLAERVKSGDAHAAAISMILPRYLAAGNVDLSAELANSVDDPFTRDKLLTEVAAKCSELDDDEYALQLVDAIEEFGLRSQALEQVALQKVAKGQIEKAMEIADSIAHPDYVFAAAAARLYADGKRDDGVDLMSRIEFPSAMVGALETIAMSELAAGNTDQCITLLNEAKDAAFEIEHNEERIRILCEVGNHYVEAGRNDLAIGAYDAAKSVAEQLDNIHRDSLIAAAALGFLHAGSLDTADRALDLIMDKTQMANCLLAFARHYWERGEKEEALDALDEAHQILRSQRETETRDSRARFALFVQIAAQFAGFEKGERAIEISQSIADDAHRTAALSQVAAILSIRGEDEQARQAINAIAEDADRAFALIGMSDAKERNGDRPKAVALLDEAAQLVEEVPQLSSRTTAYIEIARRFADHGESVKKAEICNLNLATILEIRDEGVRSSSLASLADIAGEDVEFEDEIRARLKYLIQRV
jgi:tetratricopeptide (TPR) repeat protein